MNSMLAILLCLPLAASPSLDDGAQELTDDSLDALLPFSLSRNLDLKAIAQVNPFRPPVPAPQVPAPPAPGYPQERGFFFQDFVSIRFGTVWAPLAGGGSADSWQPHLAPYNRYWHNGGGIEASFQLRVIFHVDAYVSLGTFLHASSGPHNWYKTEGATTTRVRFEFDPMLFFPTEIGGKGILAWRGGRRPGDRVQAIQRRIAMPYARFGGGPVLVTPMSLRYDRYVNDVYQDSSDETWWKTQFVLNWHFALGFEDPDVINSNPASPGWFIEAGYRWMGAPKVSNGTDVSSPFQTWTITVGIRFP